MPKYGKRRIVIAPSEKYSAWERAAVARLIAQRQLVSGCNFPIIEPINVAVRVFVTDRRRRDLLNLMGGVLDALEKARVIADDKWEIVRSHDGSTVIMADAESTEIKISFLNR